MAVIGLVVSAILFITACNSARHLDDGQYLLKRNRIDVKSSDHTLDSDELENLLKQKPNTRILGLIPFHLRVYNFLSNGKERKWKNKLQGVVGQEPVVYDEYLTSKSARQLKMYVNSKGYYQAMIHDTVRFYRKKAWVKYTITPKQPHTVRQIKYNISDSTIHRFVLQDSAGNTLLHPGGIFDFDVLEDERNRITRLIRNKGYFNFSKDFIDYEVDTTKATLRTDVSMRIKQFPSRNTDRKIVLNNHNKYKIRNVKVYLDLHQRYSRSDTAQKHLAPDTLIQQETYFFFRDELPIKPEVLLSKISIEKDQYYSEEEINQTYKLLSGLQQFKLININFEEIPEDNSPDSTKVLDCHIQLTTLTRQSYQAELEGTNSSNHWGIGGNLLYSHKNIFKGAEIFNVKLSGAFEVQRDYVGLSSEAFLPNTFEYGIETSIAIPKFWFPLNAGHNLRKYHPKTAMSFSYSHQKRSDYTRLIVNSQFGYQWNTTKFRKHRINPIELNIITLSDTSSAFSQYFDTLYLKHSYESQFISASSYTYELSTQDIKKKFSDFIFMQSRIELAGNLLNGLHHLFGVEKTAGDYFEILDNRYAQYVRGDIDFRYYQHLNESSQLVYRAFFGIGIPYGNNHVLPFVKKYFSGGANGIRAWQIRSLGPGSFIDDSSFPDMAADMKLEANIEYRFDIAWMLKGAFFVDAGNIWAINTYDDRPGALFKFDSFYDEIAIGTGVGARFDFDFLLFRIDLGIKVRDPELEQGERMIWGNRKLGIGDYSWNFGIGYPF